MSEKTVDFGFLSYILFCPLNSKVNRREEQNLNFGKFS